MPIPLTSSEEDLWKGVEDIDDATQYSEDWENFPLDNDSDDNEDMESLYEVPEDLPRSYVDEEGCDIAPPPYSYPHPLPLSQNNFLAEQLESSREVRNTSFNSDCLTRVASGSGSPLRTPPSKSLPPTPPSQKRKLHRSPSPGRPPKRFRKLPEWAENLPGKIKVNPRKDVPEFVAHHSETETLFKKFNVPIGVKWELARLISLDKLDPGYVVQNKETLLSKLSGSNAVVVPQILRLLGYSHLDSSDGDSFQEEHAAKAPWAELDKEVEALSKNEFAGIGNNNDIPGWYAGKINFTARLVMDDEDGLYTLQLQQPSLGPSNRVARRFGSFSIVRVKVKDKLLTTQDHHIDEFFMHPIVIWDWVFRAFYAKDDNVFLFRTNESFVNGNQVVPTGASGLSFDEFVAWANPLEFNQSQLLCKWAARFALVLSNSVPGPLIKPENIIWIPDIVNKDPETGELSDMTDGHGTMSRPISTWIINSHYGISTFPSAIQMRFAGWKGLTSVIPSFTEQDYKLYLRPSQLKINWDPSKTLDLAHLTIDMLRTSHLTSPSRISGEVIRNLEDNGVRPSVFKRLMDKHIQMIFDSLTEWTNENFDPSKGGEETIDMLLRLYSAVEKSEGVVGARKARRAGGESRFRGYGERTEDDADEAAEADEDGFAMANANQKSTAWWPDYISGCPSSLAETVMALLDSGFTPRNSPILRSKLEMILRKKIDHKTTKIQFEVSKSLAAWVVPDESGKLGPSQIHVKASRNLFETQDGVETDTLRGEVLITRNPCKIATDAQKVQAVDCPALAHCVDVIVCNVADSRRLLDLLSGGDYDGDRCIVIWEPEIVLPFTNAPIKYSKPELCVERSFTRDQYKVSDFLDDIKAHNISPNERRYRLQKYLFSALQDKTILGTYSVCHDNAIHKLGYSHPTTRQLAAKFNIVMDSAKSGHKILSGCYKDDKRRWKHPLGPLWKSEQQARQRRNSKNFKTTNDTYLERNYKSFPSCRFLKGRDEIMSVLWSHAKATRDKFLAQLEAKFPPLKERRGSRPTDLDLDGPWHDHCELAAKRATLGNMSLQRDLDKIKEHVVEVKRYHATRITGAEFTFLPIVERQDRLRECSRRFAALPSVDSMESLTCPHLIARLAASYAYRLDWEDRGRCRHSRFPFDVAFRELCLIKAKAQQASMKPMLTAFYERFKTVN